MDDALFGMSETPLVGSYKVTGKIGTGAFSEVRSAVLLAVQGVYPVSRICNSQAPKAPIVHAGIQGDPY